MKTYNFFRLGIILLILTTACKNETGHVEDGNYVLAEHQKKILDTVTERNVNLLHAFITLRGRHVLPKKEGPAWYFRTKRTCEESATNDLFITSDDSLYGAIPIHGYCIEFQKLVILGDTLQDTYTWELDEKARTIIHRVHIKKNPDNSFSYMPNASQDHNFEVLMDEIEKVSELLHSEIQYLEQKFANSPPLKHGDPDEDE